MSTPRPPAPSGPAGAEKRLVALVVEDDPGTADFVRIGLRYEGFDVHTCADGLQGLHLADRLRPDVVVLDWMLPGMEGIEVCRRLRTLGDPAIVMLTAKDDLTDRLTGLETGADDYVVKPFHFEELVARIRAVLRRRAAQPGKAGRALHFADLDLDPDTHEVRRAGATIELTPREFDLLQLLMEQPRRVFSKQTIVERVWGYDFAGDDNIVEVYVGYLRDKLGDRSPTRLIRTVRGVGYALRDD